MKILRTIMGAKIYHSDRGTDGQHYVLAEYHGEWITLRERNGRFTEGHHFLEYADALRDYDNRLDGQLVLVGRG